MVQAPHAATPQPNFVPVSPSTSRRYQSIGIDGSPSNVSVWPLTCRVNMLPSLSKATGFPVPSYPAIRAHDALRETGVGKLDGNCRRCKRGIKSDEAGGSKVA